ncbi:hypothetical protein WMW72_30885 [Paenibacillus filicis]|uniref:DUF3188 domain-containing protein n=1 Tax=Paenibacillus filicis TaxID=669464 RepID=A0ABU9DUD1_9BACL
MMKSIKLMILGVGFILAALFIQGTETNMIYGTEVFLAMIGAIVIVIGFFVKK